MKKLSKKMICQRETIEAYMPPCRCYCYCDTSETKAFEKAIDTGDMYDGF